MTNSILGVLLTIIFLLNGYSMHKPESSIQLLANIISYFNTAELCDHECEVFVSHDEYNRWDIRFKTALENGEDADKLCKCMRGYINQKNWLIDSTHVCVKTYDILTFVLLGPSNPADNPKISPLDEPIATLCSVLKNFKTAELGDHACTSKCRQDGSQTCLELQCELTCESPSPKVARDKILKYLSQKRLLTNANVTAKGEGKHLKVYIVGK